MGVILYCQKMYLWSEQMAYTSKRGNLLARIQEFLAIFSVPLWLKPSNGSEAAINDMSFIHNMLDFESIDAVIATAALQKILKHLWYLVNETWFMLYFLTILIKNTKSSCSKTSFVPSPDQCSL